MVRRAASMPREETRVESHPGVLELVFVHEQLGQLVLEANKRAQQYALESEQTVEEIVTNRINYLDAEDAIRRATDPWNSEFPLMDVYERTESPDIPLTPGTESV